MRGGIPQAHIEMKGEQMNETGDNDANYNGFQFSILMLIDNLYFLFLDVSYILFYISFVGNN